MIQRLDELYSVVIYWLGYGYILYYISHLFVWKTYQDDMKPQPWLSKYLHIASVIIPSWLHGLV